MDDLVIYYYSETPKADVLQSGHLSKTDNKSGTIASETSINLLIQSGHFFKADSSFSPVSVRFMEVPGEGTHQEVTTLCEPLVGCQSS